MNEVRLIDASAVVHWLENWIIDEEEVDGISPFIVASTLKDVRHHIKDAPTVSLNYFCWNPSDELPPIHHVTENGEEGPLEYDASEPLLVYTENGRIVANVRYVKSENFCGWDDWSGDLFGTKVTHWMMQPKPPKE